MSTAAQFLQPGLSPHSHISQVPLVQVRAFLLSQFQHWGMPRAIRTDNGEPFGVPTRDVVPILSLWLLAWDITPILNRPRHPQDNAKVERAQGTTSRWAELNTCPNLPILQQRLDDLVEIQREHYPVKRLGSTSRSVLYKSLHSLQRPFKRATFNAAKAYDHLAKASYPRKVSSSGSITIYGHQFQAGLSLKGKTVLVKFEPKSIGWLVFDEANQYVKTLPDPRFSHENLHQLTVCQ